jgi:hypothetical protein
LGVDEVGGDGFMLAPVLLGVDGGKFVVAVFVVLGLLVMPH